MKIAISQVRKFTHRDGEYFALTATGDDPKAPKSTLAALLLAFQFGQRTKQQLLWPTTACTEALAHLRDDASGMAWFEVDDPAEQIGKESARLLKSPADIDLCSTAPLAKGFKASNPRRLWRTGKYAFQVPFPEDLTALLAAHREALDRTGAEAPAGAEREQYSSNLAALEQLEKQVAEQAHIEENIAALKERAQREADSVALPRRLGINELRTLGKTYIENWWNLEWDRALAYAEHFAEHTSKHEGDPRLAKQHRYRYPMKCYEWVGLDDGVADIRVIDLMCEELGVPVRIYVDSHFSPIFVGKGGAEVTPVRLYWDTEDVLHVLVPAALVMEHVNSPRLDRQGMRDALVSAKLAEKFELPAALNWDSAAAALDITAGTGARTPEKQLEWLRDSQEVELEQDRQEAGPAPREWGADDLAWDAFPTSEPSAPTKETRRAYLRRARDEVMRKSEQAKSSATAAVVGRAAAADADAAAGAEGPQPGAGTFQPDSPEGWSATLVPNTCAVADLCLVSPWITYRWGKFGTEGSPARITGPVRSHFYGYAQHLPIKATDWFRFAWAPGRQGEKQNPMAERVTVQYAIRHPHMVEKAHFRVFCRSDYSDRMLWEKTLLKKEIREAFQRQAADKSMPGDTLICELEWDGKLNQDAPAGMFGIPPALKRKYGPYKLELTLDTLCFADPQQGFTYFDVIDTPVFPDAPRADNEQPPQDEAAAIVFYVPPRTPEEQAQDLENALANLAERLFSGLVSPGSEAAGGVSATVLVEQAAAEVRDQIFACFGAVGIGLDDAQRTHLLDSLRSVSEDPAGDAVTPPGGGAAARQLYWTALDAWIRQDLRLDRESFAAEGAEAPPPPKPDLGVFEGWSAPGPGHPDARVFYAAVAVDVVKTEKALFKARKEVEEQEVLYYRIDTADWAQGKRTTMEVLTRDELALRHEPEAGGGEASPAQAAAAAAPPAPAPAPDDEPEAFTLSDSDKEAIGEVVERIKRKLRARLEAEIAADTTEALLITHASVKNIGLLFSAPAAVARFRLERCVFEEVRLERTAAPEAAPAAAAPPAPDSSPPVTLIFDDVTIESQVDLLHTLLHAFGALGSRQHAYSLALRAKVYELELTALEKLVGTVLDDPESLDDNQKAALGNLQSACRAVTGTVTAAQQAARQTIDAQQAQIDRAIQTARAIGYPVPDVNEMRRTYLHGVDVLGGHALCIAPNPLGSLETACRLEVVFDSDPAKSVSIALEAGWSADEIFKAIRKGIIAGGASLGAAYLCTGVEHLDAAPACHGHLHIESHTAQPASKVPLSTVEVAGDDAALAAAGLVRGVTGVPSPSAEMVLKLLEQHYPGWEDALDEALDAQFEAVEPLVQALAWPLAIREAAAEITKKSESALQAGHDAGARIGKLTVLPVGRPQAAAGGQVEMEGVCYDLSRSEGSDDTRITVERVVVQRMLDGPVTVDQMAGTERVDRTADAGADASSGGESSLTVQAAAGDDAALRGFDYHVVRSAGGVEDRTLSLQAARLTLRDAALGDFSLRGDVSGENLFGAVKQGDSEPLSGFFRGRAGLDGVAVRTRSEELSGIHDRLRQVRAALVQEADAEAPAAPGGDADTVKLFEGLHAAIAKLDAAQKPAPGGAAGFTSEHFDVEEHLRRAKTLWQQAGAGFPERRLAYLELQKAADRVADLTMGDVPMVLFVTSASIDIHDDHGNGAIRLYIRYDAEEARKHMERSKAALEREHAAWLDGTALRPAAGAAPAFDDEKALAKHIKEKTKERDKIRKAHDKRRYFERQLSFDPDKHIADAAARHEYKGLGVEIAECGERLQRVQAIAAEIKDLKTKLGHYGTTVAWDRNVEHFMRYSADIRAHVPVESGLPNWDKVALIFEMELTGTESNLTDTKIHWAQWWNGTKVPIRTEEVPSGEKYVVIDFHGEDEAQDVIAELDRTVSKAAAAEARKAVDKVTKDKIKQATADSTLGTYAGRGAQNAMMKLFDQKTSDPIRLLDLQDAEAAAAAYSPVVFLSRLIDAQLPCSRLRMAEKALKHQYWVWDQRQIFAAQSHDAQKVAAAEKLECEACPSHLQETVLSSYQICWLKPKAAGLPPEAEAVLALEQPEINEEYIAGIEPASGHPGTPVTLTLMNVPVEGAVVKFGALEASPVAQPAAPATAAPATAAPATAAAASQASEEAPVPVDPDDEDGARAHVTVVVPDLGPGVVTVTVASGSKNLSASNAFLVSAP